MTDLNEIFKNTALQIKQPISTDDLEYLLIENGLNVPLKPIEISRRMKELGFKNKIKQVKGRRARYWVNNLMTDSKIAAKIRFYQFLTSYLQDKTEVNAKELNEAVRAEYLDIQLLLNHFYDVDGNNKRWKGWTLIKRDGEKIYKNVDIKPENLAPADDY